jgi:hypothetical protein
MNKLYWESQKNGLCRLHSLNAYFGTKKINETDFHKHCQTYNNIIKDKYNEIIESENYDIFPTYSLVSYIINHYENKYSYFIPFNELKNEGKTLKDIVHKSESFFVFNNKHIYTVKFYNKKWYKIDSLSGIIPITFDKLNGNKMGFIIPRNTNDLHFDEELLTNKIINFLKKNNINNIQDVINWFNNNYGNLLLSDLEVWLSHLEQILEKLNKSNRNLTKLIKEFYKNKNNIEFLRRNLFKTLAGLKLVTNIKK